MSVLREIAAAVVGVFALVISCDAMFGVNDARFEDDYYRSSFYAPRPPEFRFANDITPAARVNDAFAQFTHREPRLNKRYSSLITIVR
jgi:hypothetical protein